MTRWSARPGSRTEGSSGRRGKLVGQGKVVTLNLRRNVKWSNGQPTTAGDYVWSWLRTISPELGADYAYQFYGIAGAEAYNTRVELWCSPARSVIPRPSALTS